MRDRVTALHTLVVPGREDGAAGRQDGANGNTAARQAASAC